MWPNSLHGDGLAQLLTHESVRSSVSTVLRLALRHRPLLTDVVQRHFEQFQKGLIAGKRVSALDHLAQAHVHRLDGMGRVDDLPISTVY